MNTVSDNNNNGHRGSNPTSSELAHRLHRDLLRDELSHTPHAGGGGFIGSRNFAAAVAAGTLRQTQKPKQNSTPNYVAATLVSPMPRGDSYDYGNDDYFSRHELDALTTGGKRSTFDSRKLRSSTIKSLNSHISLLAQNGIDINNLQSTLTGRNINELLDSMRLQRSGAKLSPGYKLQLGNSIMKLVNNQATYNPKVYRAQRQRPAAHTASPELYGHLEQLMEFSARQIRETLYNPVIDDLTAYDTSMVVLLTAGMPLHLEELQQLKMSDVIDILEKKKIYIRSKNSRIDERTILPHTYLKTLLFTQLFNRKKAMIAAKRNDNVNAIEYKATRLRERYMLLTSNSQLLRTLKQHASIIGLRIDHLGFNKFRKLTISMLVENGASEIARFVNMHSTLRTTVHNYYISTARQLGRVQSDLRGDGSAAATTNTTTTTDTVDNDSSSVKWQKTQASTTETTEQSPVAETSLQDELNTAYPPHHLTSTTPDDFDIVGDGDSYNDDYTFYGIHLLTPPETPDWKKS